MKTEHEKLLAGQAYDYRDPELQQLIVRGKQLLTVINGGQGAARQAAIQDFFGRMGQRLTINGYFNAVYGVHIQVGDDVFINGGNVSMIRAGTPATTILSGTSFKYWGTYLFHSVPVNAHGKYVVNEAKKLGKRASHGCVRLRVADAHWIYSHVPYKMKVVIH